MNSIIFSVLLERVLDYSYTFTVYELRIVSYRKSTRTRMHKFARFQNLIQHGRS